MCIQCSTIRMNSREQRGKCLQECKTCVMNYWCLLESKTCDMNYSSFLLNDLLFGHFGHDNRKYASRTLPWNNDKEPDNMLQFLSVAEAHFSEKLSTFLFPPLKPQSTFRTMSWIHAKIVTIVLHLRDCHKFRQS